MMRSNVMKITLMAWMLAAAAPAHAAQTTEGCRAAKLQAAASASLKKLKCWVAAVKEGVFSPDMECFNHADTKMSVDFVRIESRGACSPSGDAADYLSKVNDFVYAIAVINPCPAKVNAAGSELQSALKCHAKAIKKGDPVSSGCLDKAEAAFFKKADKADTKGCMPTGDTSTVQAQVDAAIAAFVPPSPIRLFSAGPQASSLLGNRATTNGKCRAAATTQSLRCSSVVSLLSYTGDQVSDFPTSVSIPTSVAILAGAQTLASSWADFLDGSWNTCLGSFCSPAGPTGANVYTGGAWTGTNPDGTLGANCQNWTSTDGGGRNALTVCYGVQDYASCETGGTLSYASVNLTSCSASSQALLCLCF